ncbi:MAG: hypothetical protein QGH13_01175, partial [Candidatus Thalassarchaeaceae archaeon]|nr:hypothetical protein [Candidatus Thalassarchaeaceae archaeon]
MQECQVCGLLFGGGDRCPECKSIFGSTIEIDQDDTLPSGPLPGTESLVEILPEVDGLSGPTSNDSESRTNLPFTLGGARASPKVQLLFGAGTRSNLLTDETDSQNENHLDTEHIDAEPQYQSLADESPPQIQPEVEPDFVSEEEHYDQSLDEEQFDDEPMLLESRPIVHTEINQSNDSEDIVYHDFSEEMNFSEVEVDFDNLVDPAE